MILVGVAYHRISRYYLLAGRLDEAMTWAGKGVALLQETKHQLEVGRALARLADVLDAQGRSDLASGTRDKALIISEALGASYDARTVRAPQTPSFKES